MKKILNDIILDDLEKTSEKLNSADKEGKIKILRDNRHLREAIELSLELGKEPTPVKTEMGFIDLLKNFRKMSTPEFLSNFKTISNSHSEFQLLLLDMLDGNLLIDIDTDFLNEAYDGK